ncbi:MAG: PDZ domain-containing protein [Ignavibacteriaceae bacterium]
MKRSAKLITALFILFFILVADMQAQNVKLEYFLSMSKPYTHYFEVTTKVTGLQKKYIDFLMPVWAPGSYLVRDFPKNVEFFHAYGTNGNELKFEKINKYTWRVYSNNSDEVKIKYDVYAFETSVRTSFLDSNHGYLNGTSIFMYIDKMKDLPSTLTITPYKDWKKISTGLESEAGKNFTYHSPNYDILADSPIEIGNQDVFEFDAAGVKHYVAMYGKANYNVDTLKKYMAKIVEEETKVIGENPNKHYTFIVHNLKRGSGGLEHLNSTTLEVNRWIYSPNMLMRFLGTVSHEYFHLWNVKRIRPIALGPFDYQKENYTRLLWEMEGVTSYYGSLILERAGMISPEHYLGRVSGGISYVKGQPGRKVQSPAESSFDTWIKQYQPNENSNNTTLSYYVSGAILGGILDLEIIDKTNGKSNYDDVLKYLYNEYYKKLGRGFTDKEYKTVVEKVAGENLDQFFNDYVYSTNDIDYNKYFGYAGLKLIDNGTDENHFGARTFNKNGKLIVRSVEVGTSAYDGGINANDEIIALNGYRVDIDNFKKIINQFKAGDILNVTVSRDGIIKTLDVKLMAHHNYKYKLVKVDNPTEKQQMVYNKWLSIK